MRSEKSRHRPVAHLHSLFALLYTHTHTQTNFFFRPLFPGPTPHHFGPTPHHFVPKLIYADTHKQPQCFDVFAECNVLSLFIRLVKQAASAKLRKTDGAVRLAIQVIQTLTILTQKLRNRNNLYYLMSNNHLNELIAHPFDFGRAQEACGDEELLAYYVSFLKLLSLKLNAETIQFFFDERTGDFPLYSQATKLFDCAEMMVRTSVRTIILNIYRVQVRA